MTTAIIADDHEIVRRGLRIILETDGACRVLGEASDGLMAVQLVEKFKPTVLLLDLNMPRLHGIEVLRPAYERGAIPIARRVLPVRIQR